MSLVTIGDSEQWTGFAAAIACLLTEEVDTCFSSHTPRGFGSPLPAISKVRASCPKARVGGRAGEWAGDASGGYTRSRKPETHTSLG